MQSKIGITATFMVEPTARAALDWRYHRAVQWAGGLPIILAGEDESLATAFAGLCDGLLLSGGGDLAPGRDDDERRPTDEGINQQRDVFEFALLDAFLRA